MSEHVFTDTWVDSQIREMSIEKKERWKGQADKVVNADQQSHLLKKILSVRFWVIFSGLHTLFERHNHFTNPPFRVSQSPVLFTITQPCVISHRIGYEAFIHSVVLKIACGWGFIKYFSVIISSMSQILLIIWTVLSVK